jgi:predicted phosphodiesterase
VLNPGSPTERRRASVRSMLVLDVEKGLKPRFLSLA